MKNKTLILLSLAIITGLMVSCGRPAGPSQGGVQRRPDMLSDFEAMKVWDISPEEGFSLSLSKDYVTEGEYSLKVVYPKRKLPSINTKKLERKWDEYELFSFDVYNPQQEKIDFAIRLDDDQKRRVKINYPLGSGWNHVQVPREDIAGEINAHHISRVVLFLKKPDKRVTLYFDNMRLVRTQNIGNQRMEAKREELSGNKEGYKSPDVKEVFEPFTVESALPSKGAMRVPVANLSNPRKRNVWVSTGIPFAPGQLTDERKFAVFDGRGEEVSIATDVLARWTYDNSIRSLLVQFPMHIEHRYEGVTLQWGRPRTTQDRERVEVNWIVPEGYIVLPAKWLCESGVIGEQVPMDQHPFPSFDERAEKYYPSIRAIPWVGDVRKDGYYGTAHVFYQFYVRTGDEQFFIDARREAVHYRDDQIIQEGPKRGRNVTYKKPRYVYVQSVIDDYLLTGDRRSLRVAGYMAEYLKDNFSPSKAFFPRNGTHFWTERYVAFPFLGIVSYYELTGDEDYLAIAKTYMKNLYKTQQQWPGRGGFIHNLYSHDPDEGARKDEYGGSPFMTGLLLEAIVKYHKLTNSNIAAPWIG